MISNITSARAGEAEGLLFDSWFDPIEVGLRTKVRGFIEMMIEEELTTVLSRPRYGRRQDRKEAAVGVVGVPAWPPHAAADRHVRVDRHRGAAGPSSWRRRRQERVE